MSDLKSRVAYLQGLSAGLDLGAESKEGKLLMGIIEVLDEFADQVGGLEEAQEQMEEYLESMDEDLYHLEDEIYDDDMDSYDTGADDYMEVDCPKCGETVCFDSGILADEDVIEVTCPNCDKVVFINDDSHRAVPVTETAGMLNVVEDDII
ncbi:MAG: AraC family transcriptional regulator [Desulfotomaculaceae bacterium]|nr:AraC family transcriptional regulator [Desulfotomaculaceae bacterium]